MAYWGATVITSLLKSLPTIGEDVFMIACGGGELGDLTVAKFSTLHYILPLASIWVITQHISAMHVCGGNSTLGICNKTEKIVFYDTFILKDIVITLGVFLVISYSVYFLPNSSIHVGNFQPVDGLKTPRHIHPE